MKTFRIALAIGLLLSSMLSIAQQNSEVIDMKKHKIVIQFADSDSVAQVRVTQQVGNVLRCWRKITFRSADAWICVVDKLDIFPSLNFAQILSSNASGISLFRNTTVAVDQYQ